MKKFLLYSSLFLASLGVHAQTYSIFKVTTAPTIDGDVTEWTNPFFGPFVVHNTGASALQVTKVALAWDNSALYLAYTCKDSKIVGSAQAQDASIFNTDDLVEVFLDPDGDHKNYVELGANAYSTNYDIILKCVESACGGWSDDMPWDLSGLQTVSKKVSGGFNVEIKIPFAGLNAVPNGSFSTPSIGTIWKGNLCRIDYGASNVDYLAISTFTSGAFGFHQPAYFKSFKFEDVPTGIVNTLNSNFQVYPNPFENEIVVEGNPIVKIELYSLSGNLILNNENSNSINTSEISKGLYILKLYTSAGVEVVKMVK